MKLVCLRRNLIGAVFGAVALLFNSMLNAQTLDPAFNAAPDGPVSTIALQSDGKILIGGNFSQVGNTPRAYLARLNADGSLDNSFAPANGPAQYVARIVVRGDKIYVAAGDGLRRFSNNGTLDWLYPMSFSTFDVDAQQRVVFGGQFTRVDNQAHRNIARLSSAGALDSTFATQVGCCPGDGVSAVVLQGETIVIGGLFPSVNGTPANHFAALNSDGTLNTSFQNTAEAPVFALAATADGKVFRATQQTLTRHLSSGSADASFPPASAGGSSDDRFAVLAAMPDGGAMVAGNFSVPNSTERRFIARFESDGSFDESFAVHPDNLVQAIAVQPNGSVLIGGFFSSVNGSPAAGIARIQSTATSQSLALQISPASAGQISLSWPVNDGLVLESRGLNETTWTAATETPATVNGRSVVVTSAASEGRIFRLRANSSANLRIASTP